MLLRIGCLAICLFTNVAWGKYASYKTYAGTVSLDLSANWIVTKNIWGLPLSFLGPMQTDGTRAALTIIGAKEKHTPIADISPKGAEIALKEYKAERTQWLSQKQATSLQYLPVEERKLEQGKMLVLGHVYEKRSRRYTQLTFKVLCQKQYYHAVALVPATSESYLGGIHTMMNGLKCL